MERIENINIERVYWCCEDQGISLDELATSVSIPQGSFSKFLNREKGLTFNQLNKIADYFGRGVLFFLEEGEVDEKLVHSSQFRTITNQKPKLSGELRRYIERVEKQRDIFKSLIEDADEDLTAKLGELTYKTSDPIAIATAARDWLDLGELNNFDSYRTAIESKGVLVFRSNGYVGQWQIPKHSPILGFSIYDDVCPVIVVRKQEFPTRQTFTLAHELGHLLLHKSSYIDDANDFESTANHEKEANTFAGHFLVPSEFLATITSQAPRGISEFESWLSPFKKRWGASYEVILRRLIEDKYVSPHRLTEYREWREKLPEPVNQSGGTRTYRHREPKHIFGDRFVRVVLDSVNSNQITLAKASDYLDRLKVKDIHQLEDYYARI